MFTIAIMITVDYHDNRLITTIAQLYSIINYKFHCILAILPCKYQSNLLSIIVHKYLCVCATSERVFSIGHGVQVASKSHKVNSLILLVKNLSIVHASIPGTCIIQYCNRTAILT